MDLDCPDAEKHQDDLYERSAEDRRYEQEICILHDEHNVQDKVLYEVFQATGWRCDVQRKEPVAVIHHFLKWVYRSPSE